MWLSLATVGAAAGEFAVYARAAFSADACRLSKDGEVYSFPPATPNAHLLVRVYPAGKPSARLPLRLDAEDAFDGSAPAVTFGPDDSRHILMQLGGLGKIPSSSDLNAAFAVHVPAGTTNLTLQCHNYTQKANRQRYIAVVGDAWQVVATRLNGPGFLDDGDILDDVTLLNLGTSWRLAFAAVWRGDDPEPPTAPAGLRVAFDGEANRLAWNPSTDNLFVARYHVHRGSVPNFPIDEQTRIGETFRPAFVDAALMRPGYFYVVVAEDCAGNRSAPSAAAKPMREKRRERP